LNKVALPMIEGRCSTEIIPLLPKSDVCRNYIAFLLRRKETIDYVMPENTGSRMPRADMKHLLDMEISLPSIDKQRRIATEIERQLAVVEKAKQAAQEQLAAARELAGGDVPYSRFSRIKTVEYMIPVYTNGETNDGFFGYTDYARVTKKSVTISGRGTIGYSSVREAGYYPAIRLIAAIPKDSLDANFLHYSLLCNDFRKDGTSIPQLTVPMVKEIEIALPKLDEQQRIVEYLGDHYAKTSKTIFALQGQLDTITAMPAAILRQAFSGQM
jgi:restriction endonuclease S subunit